MAMDRLFQLMKEKSASDMFFAVNSPVHIKINGTMVPINQQKLDNANILALLAGAAAVVFPVDDLWGKVDLPIVLLEAMALGVPVIVLDRGPLQDLQGVLKVPSLDAASWLTQIASLLADSARCAALVANQRAALAERHAAAVVARAYEDLYLELAH